MEKLWVDYSLNTQARQILDEMRRRGLKLCAGESCTGGLIANAFVSINSASDVFLGSLVCYCAAAKINLAGVSKEAAFENQSVNERCAREFAQGALAKYGADYAISSTGFAEEDKDVFLCVANRTSAVVEKFNFKGSRNEIRADATRKALYMLQRLLQNSAQQTEK